MLSRSDFYKIAEYVNENWRGFFPRSGLQTYADEYYYDYIAAKKSGVIEKGSPLDGLIMGMVEDYLNADAVELGNWLEDMAYEFHFRDFEELIREFQK